jgi:hypothetical protein
MTLLVIVTMLLVSGLLAGTAWAQAPVPPATPIMPAPGAAAPVDGSGWIMASILVLGLFVVVGALVKLFDLRRKREAEAVHLQAQISDALLRDPNLFGLPITPTAHAPLWSGTPVTVEMAGEVPSAAVQESVLRIAWAEAQRIRPDVEIRDRLTIRALERVA